MPNSKEYFKGFGIEPRIFKDFTSLFYVLEAGRVDGILIPSFLYKAFVHENHIEDTLLGKAGRARIRINPANPMAITKGR